jgi:NADH dehydrogenase
MIFIAGGTGFVGGHLLDGLIASGHSLKCLVRSEKAEKSLTDRGIEVIRGDISEPDTLKGILTAEDFVVHLVGIMEEKKGVTFRSVHVEGTSHLLEEAKRAGVRHFFYQSALGADKNSWSGYLKTKAEAEELVRNSGLEYTIFRPSLIIGPWDGFTKKLVELIKLSPVVPVPGDGKAKFQPIYVKDWVACMKKVLEDPASYTSTFDIGGPEHITYFEMVETLSKALGRDKAIAKVPMGIMKVAAAFMEAVLPSPPVTSDQLRLLEMDNISDPMAVEKKFGFRPVSFREALKEFIQ